MQLKEFENLIKYHKSFFDKLSKLHDLGFDFYEGKFQLVTDVDQMFDSIVSSVYNEEGLDWINWFIYETHYGKKDMEAKDENQNPICYDVKSLHEYIEKYYKK